MLCENTYEEQQAAEETVAAVPFKRGRETQKRPHTHFNERAKQHSTCVCERFLFQFNIQLKLHLCWKR